MVVEVNVYTGKVSSIDEKVRKCDIDHIFGGEMDVHYTANIPPLPLRW